MSCEGRLCFSTASLNNIFTLSTGKMMDQWPEYPTGIALLSHDLTVVHNDSAFHCQFWQDKGFYPYAVIN